MWQQWEILADWLRLFHSFVTCGSPVIFPSFFLLPTLFLFIRTDWRLNVLRLDVVVWFWWIESLILSGTCYSKWDIILGDSAVEVCTTPYHSKAVRHTFRWWSCGGVFRRSDAHRSAHLCGFEQLRYWFAAAFTLMIFAIFWVWSEVDYRI